MPGKKIIGEQNFPKVLNELRRLHKEYPTMRLGTLIQSAIDTRKKRHNFDLNNVSTKELLDSVQNFGKMLKEKTVRRPR